MESTSRVTTAPEFTTLISTAQLAERIGRAKWVIVDCRFALDDVDWGRRVHAAGHIPGATYAHLDADLSGARNGSNGRHPLPGLDVLRATLGRLGIARGVQVVAYDQDNGMYASRLWWMLRWLGHDAVAVLDGGFAKWVAEDRACVSGAEPATAREFSGEPRGDMLVDASDVASWIGDPGWRLLDARAPERYRGETEPLDRVAGHIPGAANQFYRTNLAGDGTYLPAGDLRRAYALSIGDVAADHVVCYCGSGVTACHNLLALEHAGLRGAKLYAGSWSEWSSDPARAVERTDAR